MTLDPFNVTRRCSKLQDIQRPAHTAILMAVSETGKKQKFVSCGEYENFCYVGTRRSLKELAMADNAEIKDKIFKALATVLEGSSIAVSDDTPLIGNNRALDSMKLLELCVSLEDIAADLGFEFDWTSEDAMSKSRSMFRTAGALANEFLSQMAIKK